MAGSGEFPGLNTPDIDSSSSLNGLGPIELQQPTQDIDGDGVLDSVTTTNDGTVQVWTDFDHDGIADHVKIVEEDGDYAAWEFHRRPDGTSEWVRTDKGRIGN
ncbi:DUF6802 family protein [Nocardia sp. CNY236]|uniref:DUF6802 family protein n=1 Tax=Nocardia sp. CNY236 TaxID=1169152 RepID=UPI0003FCC172|nr:DUF6802 family protein [Nocardia sp. CNY236]